MKSNTLPDIFFSSMFRVIGTATICAFIIILLLLSACSEDESTYSQINQAKSSIRSAVSSGEMPQAQVCPAMRRVQLSAGLRMVAQTIS